MICAINKERENHVTIIFYGQGGKLARWHSTEAFVAAMCDGDIIFKVGDRIHVVAKSTEEDGRLNCAP